MNQNTLYEKDFIAWIKQQAKLLKNHNFEELDLENLVEELLCLIHQEQHFTALCARITDNKKEEK